MIHADIEQGRDQQGLNFIINLLWSLCVDVDAIEDSVHRASSSATPLLPHLHALDRHARVTTTPPRREPRAVRLPEIAHRVRASVVPGLGADPVSVCLIST